MNHTSQKTPAVPAAGIPDNVSGEPADTTRREIGVCVLSGSRLYREAVSARLALEDGLAPPAAAATPQELFRAARACPVDVLLVHWEGGPEPIEETIADAKALFPGVRVIVLADSRGAGHVVRCIEAGATACLDYGTSYSALLETVRAVHEGRSVLDCRVIGRLLRRIGELAESGRDAEPFRPGRLSAREAEIARLVASALPNKQIAKRLALKVPTVKSHVYRIMRKLKIKRRRDIIRRAYGSGTRE